MPMLIIFEYLLNLCLYTHRQSILFVNKYSSSQRHSCFILMQFQLSYYISWAGTSLKCKFMLILKNSATRGFCDTRHFRFLQTWTSFNSQSSLNDYQYPISYIWGMGHKTHNRWNGKGKIAIKNLTGFFLFPSLIGIWF